MLQFIGFRNFQPCLVFTKRVDLKIKKKKETRNLDVDETKRREKCILDGFELWGTQQRAVGSAMASVLELP